MTENQNCTQLCNVYVLSKSELQRIEEVFNLQVKRIDDKLDSHIEIAEKMAAIECDRIKMVHEMDTRSYDQALNQASEHRLTLSNRMSTMNDNLRNLIAATEDVITKQLEQRMEHNGDRITTLERTQYETKGKDQTSRAVIAFIAALVGAVITMGLQRFFFMGK